MSKDRPAGMDGMNMKRPTPTQRTPMRKNEMPAVVKAAGGPVDTSRGGHFKIPKQ